MGEGSGLLGVIVCERPSSTPVSARDISSPHRNCWRWHSSGRGHFNSSCPPSTLNQLESSSLCPQSPMLARASGRPSPPWHLSPDCHLWMRGPPLSKGHMPLLLAKGTGHPHSMTSPGDLPPTIPRIGISGISIFLTDGDFQSSSGCWSTSS